MLGLSDACFKGLRGRERQLRELRAAGRIVRVHLQSGVANRELDDELLDAQQRVSGCPQVRGAGARHYATTDAGGAVAAAPPTGKPAAVTPAARLSASARFPASVPTG